MFSNHPGYVFHDSRGFEAGGDEELKIVQEFIRERSGKRHLRERIHAIWYVLPSVHESRMLLLMVICYRYCVPMDNQRPELDLKHFNNICPDQNGMLLRAILRLFDALVSSASHCGLHQV